MQKLFHFDCPREVYQADACIISCFDFRFDTALHKFVKRRGVAVYDQIKIPGSVKAVVAPDRASDRDFVLSMLRTSLRLHRPSRLLLFAHNDCGAYPGVSADVVAADVAKAAVILKAAEPSLPVESYFCDFDGIYGIE
jgi:hypothetical protein